MDDVIYRHSGIIYAVLPRPVFDIFSLDSRGDRPEGRGSGQKCLRWPGKSIAFLTGSIPGRIWLCLIQSMLHPFDHSHKNFLAGGTSKSAVGFHFDQLVEAGAVTNRANIFGHGIPLLRQVFNFTACPKPVHFAGSHPFPLRLPSLGSCCAESGKRLCGRFHLRSH